MGEKVINLTKEKGKTEIRKHSKLGKKRWQALRLNASIISINKLNPCLKRQKLSSYVKNPSRYYLNEIYLK